MDLITNTELGPTLGSDPKARVLALREISASHAPLLPRAPETRKSPMFPRSLPTGAWAPY